MEWVSRAWVDADQSHWVEEDTGQVVEEACTLAVVASDPYLGKTSVGHWEVAYQADNALLACMAQACRLRAGQEEASPGS